jgi:ABC-2 type transport system permease protein
MKIGNVCQPTIFCALIRTHFASIKNQFADMIINLYIWTFCSLVIMGYIMQSFGLDANYGCFQLAGIIGTTGLFEIYHNVTKQVMDFDGDKTISYYLTLPTKPWIVFGSFAVFYSLVGIVLSFFVLPFGKLVLYNSFSLGNVSWLKALGMVIVSNVFFSILSLAIVTHVGTISKMRNVWTRFIFPLWILGGFQFSWAVAYTISPVFAYALLLNPVVFIMEGSRAALLGQAGFLRWELCFSALIAYATICWFYMYYRMRKLLDIV